MSKSTTHLLSMLLTLECVRILSWSISFFQFQFFSFSIVSLIMFCVRLLSELIILLSIHHVTNHLICRNKLRWTINCNLILKIKIFEKIFYFSSAFFFTLKCQDLVIKVIHSTSNIKSCYPELVKKSCFEDLKFLTDNFTIDVLWNQTFPSLFIAISSSFMHK